MKIEDLEKAKFLQRSIQYLETKIKIFQGSEFVYLQVMDHYGNKGPIIETYAFNEHYTEAAGIRFDDFVSKSYKEFLDKVRNKMQERINLLKKELAEL